MTVTSVHGSSRKNEKTLDDDNLTPAEVISSTWRWFPAALTVTVAVLLLGGLVTFIGWQANWWFAAHNATRQAQITQNGYANQVTLRQQVTEKLSEVELITSQIAVHPELAAAEKPQRMAIADIVCQDAAQVTGTPLPADQRKWVSVNCKDGSVSPESSLYQAGQP